MFKAISGDSGSGGVRPGQMPKFAPTLLQTPIIVCLSASAVLWLGEPSRGLYQAELSPDGLTALLTTQARASTC